MKTAVLVLGMHRSGTSAMTGSLEKMGVALPQDLLPPLEDNPKGFFEGRKVVEINDRLLSSLGSSWDDTRFQLPIADEIIEQHLPEAKQFLKEEFSYNKIFALKDPRMCITFPLWERAFKELNIEIKIIIPYRNPLEIARSLKQRNGFSNEKSLLLWVKHLLHAELYSRPYPRQFISFNALLSNTVDELKKTSDLIKLKTSDEVLDVIKKRFLEKSLKHHSLDVNNITGEIPDFMAKLMEYIKDDSFATAKTQDFDSIYNDVKAIYNLLHTYDVQFHSQISRDLHWQRDQAVEQLELLEATLSRFQQSDAEQRAQSQTELEKFQRLNDEGRVREQQLESELASVLNDLGAIKDAKQGLQRELEQLTEQTQVYAVSLEEKNAQLERLESTLARLKQSDAEQRAQSQTELEKFQRLNDEGRVREQQLESELASVLNDLGAIKDAKQGLQRELEQLTEQTQVYAVSLEEKNAQLERLESTLARLKQSDAEQRAQSQAELEKFQRLNDEGRVREQQLESELASVLNDLGAIKDAKQGLQRELEQLTEQTQVYAVSLEEKNAQLERLESALTRLEQTHTEQVVQYKLEIENLKTEKKDLKDLEIQLKSEVKGLLSDIIKLKDKKL